MDGVVLIDKPSGVTSFDVVKKVRRVASERKVGHAGTLDPLASGLLVVALGQGTKLVPYLMEGEKRYLGTIALGAETDTDDALGKITESADVPQLDRSTIEGALEKFTGWIDQVPPEYSALKQGGEPLYRKARRGERVSPVTRKVEIIGMELLELRGSELDLEVCCKKGTYIRSLARDMGLELGTRGHLKALRRIETSGFHVSNATPLNSLDGDTLAGTLLALEEALPSMHKIKLNEKDQSRVEKGQHLEDLDESVFLPLKTDYLNRNIGLLRPDGRLLAIGIVEEDVVRPVRVMVWS